MQKDDAVKRPLIFILILLTVSWILLSKAGNETDSPLFITEQLLYQEIGEGQNMTVSGYVTKCSVISSGVRLFIDHISVLSDNKSLKSFLPDQMITVTISQKEIMPGDWITVAGDFAPFSRGTNPGQFDLKAWYFRQNVVCTMKNVRILKYQNGNGGLQELLYRIKNAFWVSFGRIFPEKAAGTIAAISLGEKGLMEKEWKNRYQEGGIAHIMAVSGLHVTLIGMSLYRFMRWICIPVWCSSLISGGTVILYTLMTGSGISAMRAMIMFLICLGAQVYGRKYDQLIAIVIAAAILLVSDVQVIQESSFWLSFSAVLTLTILVPHIQYTCRITSKPGNALCSSLGIWIGMLPVTLYFFYQAVPWGILINLAIIPLMSVVLSTGFLAAVLGYFSIPAGIFTGAPVQYLIQLFDLLCEIQQKLPGAVWVAGCPGWSQIILYYIVLAVFVCITRNIRRIIPQMSKMKSKVCCIGLWLVFLVVGAGILGHHENDLLQVTCLDVGQGDSAVIQIPDGPTCIVDCGSSSESSIWSWCAEQTVKYYGISTLDYVFLSHGDMDHISGIQEFLETYEKGWNGKNVHGITLKTLVLPPTAKLSDFNEIKQLADKKGIKILQMETGDYLESSSAKWNIRCLSPEKEALTGDSNQDSMVLMIQYGKFRMLFTGDLEKDAEKKISEWTENEWLDADVLKVGHHGSGNSSSEEFLQKVSPRAAVISCGKNNNYGHPADETLERLQHAGAEIFLTADQGAVQIHSDGERFRIDTYLKEIRPVS